MKTYKKLSKSLLIWALYASHISNLGVFVNRIINQFISLIFVISLMIVLASCKSHDAMNFEANTKGEIIEFIDGNPGQVVSISVVDADNTYQYHLGTLSNGNKPDNQTIYEIASITKTYAGLVVAKAIQDGKVELDKDIRHYLKNNEYKNLELSNQYITIRHLMTHTSGLPQEFAYSSEDKAKGVAVAFEKMSKYSKEDYFDDLKKVKLNSIPGEDYLYSSVGTNLAGYILESVYQKPFALLVSEFITAKSGEQDTKFRGTHFKPGEITIGIRNGEQMPLSSAYSFAGGGLTTNVESITQYIQHQLSAEPEVAISHQLLDESWTGHGMAFSWYTNNYDSNEQVLYHSGGSIGTSSWLAIYPKKNMGIFIVTNFAGRNTQPKLGEIADKVIDYLTVYNQELNSKS
ncbi:beta-lactamase family protein [Pseudoalteromonas luteoviolacea]|uniref:serine hydrolase domain-containing protein n=1 Tax=Pseudoalteromonas luteoviolacea TaxID=43657 RepID=UPI001F455222|nr:serine hydrolase domain-containing protein [Pseudoalteromonas luteoviolacea]MCF6442931.1 beta-lactamase family protein [Pseudoalteromonas luteoviolacea]